MNGERAGSDAGAERVDVVLYPSGEVKAVPAGKGSEIARSQNRGRSGSVLEDELVLLTGVAAVFGGGILAVGAFVLSTFLLGTFVVGLVVALVVGILAVAAVGGVALWRRGGETSAELLDEAVTLRDAREQWDAAAVSAVAPPTERDREHTRAREHASEGGPG